MRAFFYRCVGTIYTVILISTFTNGSKMMKSFKIALLLALMLPVVTDASAFSGPSKSSSFKSGFSSGKSSSASSSRTSSSSKGGFGSFGSRSSTSSTPAPKTPDAAPAKSGGFGAFGGSSATPQKSDSALSQRLSKGDAQANAIRTYDERKAAEAARNAPPPAPVPSAPSYAGNGGAQPGYNGPQPSYGPAPIIINNGNGNSGFGNIVTGFLLGRAMSPSHAHAGNYPGTVASGVPAGTGAVAAPPGGNSFFMSVLRTFAWLAIIALVGWGLYFLWKFLRRGSDSSRANYSFDRN